MVALVTVGEWAYGERYGRSSPASPCRGRSAGQPLGSVDGQTALVAKASEAEADPREVVDSITIDEPVYAKSLD